MQRLILFLLLATQLTAMAQPYRYVSRKTASGALINLKESIPGTNEFDTKIAGSLPANATPARVGARWRKPYTPEAKGVITPEQFGLNLYYSPNFHFAVDFKGFKSVNDRKAFGQNTFTTWSVLPEHQGQLKPGDQLIYSTENFLGPAHPAPQFYFTTLQDFLNLTWYQVPACGYAPYENVKYWVMDIESLLFLDPGNAQDTPYPGFGGGYFDRNGGGNGNWDNYKNQVVKMEATGETMSWDQLARRGYAAWYQEIFQRRANRMALLMEECRLKSAPGTLIAQGAPMLLTPRIDFLSGSGIYIDGYCNVRYAGGDEQGNITLNVPPATPHTFKLSGDIYSHEDFNQGYWYRGDFDMEAADEQAIFYQHQAGTQNYAYLWSKIKPFHLMAEEKGFIELQQDRMLKRQGALRPFWRQIEATYEGAHNNLHNPFPEMQNLVRFHNDAYRDTPRIYKPPWIVHGEYCVTRFFAGDQKDWGFYLFPNSPDEICVDMINSPYPDDRAWYNQEFHTVTAAYQARADMQIYEAFYPGSTFVKDPEVQVGATGLFQAYSGLEAQAYNAGVQGVQRPSYMLRYKAVPGGWRVVIQGGMNQAFGAERVDVVRVPGGAVNGAQFKVKLTGPEVQTVEFFVASTEQNQTYEALPVAVPARTKAAYSGRIAN